MSVRVTGAAAQDWTATHHSPPPPPTFHLVEVPTGSIQDPQSSLPSEFVVIPRVKHIFINKNLKLLNRFRPVTDIFSS